MATDYRGPATARPEETKLLSKGSRHFRLGGTSSTTFRRCVPDTWCAEALAILLSSASLVAIAVVARVYDGQLVPALYKGLTLNAIVSILATTSKARLLYCTASSLSQYKWVWFKQGQRRGLRDLQTFDDATRGPLGALQLCTTSVWSVVALFGASVVIMATFLDPFYQQILTYSTETVYVPSNLTSTRAARHFPPAAPLSPPDSDVAYSTSVYGYDNPYNLAVFAEAVWPAYSAQFARQPVCASANCSWDSFSSLGFCGQCADTGERTFIRNCSLKPDSFDNYSSIIANGSENPILKKTCDIEFDAGLTLPFDVVMEWEPHAVFGGAYGAWQSNLTIFTAEVLYDGVPTLTNTQNITYTGPQKNILSVEEPLVALGAATLNASDDAMVVSTAQLCTIDYCVRQFDINVTNGMTHVTIPRIEHGTKFIGADEGQCWTVAQPPFNSGPWLNFPLVRSAPVSMTGPDGGGGMEPMYNGSTRLGVENFAFCYDDSNGLHSLGSFLKTTAIVGNATTWTYICGDGVEDCSSTPDLDFDDKSLGVEWTSSETQRINQTGFTNLVMNLEASLNKHMLESTGYNVLGKAGANVTFVRVRWLWLILPLVLQTMGLIFFLATICSSRKFKIPLWKASLWPILFMNVLDSVPAAALQAEDVSQMRASIDKTKVMLQPTANGNLVLQSATGALET